MKLILVSDYRVQLIAFASSSRCPTPSSLYSSTACSRRVHQICHVVTRMRGERGRTTGVLDREITEQKEDKEATDALAHAQTRRYTETATKRDNRNETNASMCVYIGIF